MSTLRASPFNLLYNNEVVAQVSAVNAKGTSAASTVSSSGALIKTEPPLMSAPTQSTVLSTSIAVTFIALTTDSEIGGSPITKYILSHRLTSAGSYTETDVGVVTSPITISGLTPNSQYDFIISAYNLFGHTDSTPITQITTLTDVPTAPTNVVTAYASSGVNIEITAQQKVQQQVKQ